MKGFYWLIFLVVLVCGVLYFLNNNFFINKQRVVVDDGKLDNGYVGIVGSIPDWKENPIEAEVQKGKLIERLESMVKEDEPGDLLIRSNLGEDIYWNRCGGDAYDGDYMIDVFGVVAGIEESNDSYLVKLISPEGCPVYSYDFVVAKIEDTISKVIPGINVIYEKTSLLPFSTFYVVYEKVDSDEFIEKDYGVLRDIEGGLESLVGKKIVVDFNYMGNLYFNRDLKPYAEKVYLVN